MHPIHHKKHLQHLKAAVREHQADIGIALDGDGDRVVLLDERAMCFQQIVCCLYFAEMCLKTHPQHQVCLMLKCSTMVRNTVRDLGGEAVMIRTGSHLLASLFGAVTRQSCIRWRIRRPLCI